jgi:hypothetical protein
MRSSFALLLILLTGVFFRPATRGGLPAVAMLRAPKEERLTLPDLDGTPRTVPDPKAKVTALLFITHDCPISNAYAPEMNRLCAEYGKRGVAFYLVYVDPELAAGAAREHAREYGFACPALLDRTHILVKQAGATITPEAVLFDPGGRRLYRGRIDDRYVDFGRARPAPTRRDLRDALDAALAGKPVPNPRTRAIGCFIPGERQ